MEQIECSETSAYKIQTPGNHPEENIQHTEHGESLKSKILHDMYDTDIWPISKETLIRKPFKIFVKFTNEISFDKLNEVSHPPYQAS
jgi:hypothetical protein